MNPGYHYICNVNATDLAVREGRYFSWWPLETKTIRPYYPGNRPDNSRTVILGGHSQ